MQTFRIFKFLITKQNFMKKILTLATAALLISGVSFAHGKDDKKGEKKCSGKTCSKAAMKKDSAKNADPKKA